jgi:hypothetical protein
VARALTQMYRAVPRQTLASLPETSMPRRRGFRRLMAIYWLLMLLPGSLGHDRNPAGSLEDQAGHVLRLL